MTGRAWVGKLRSRGRRGATVARSFSQFLRFLCGFSQKKAGIFFESHQNASIRLLDSSVACLRRPLWTQTRPHAQNTFPCKRFFAFCEFLFWKERTYLTERLARKSNLAVDRLSLALIASLLGPQRTRNRPCIKNVFLACGCRCLARN